MKYFLHNLLLLVFFSLLLSAVSPKNTNDEIKTVEELEELLQSTGFQEFQNDDEETLDLMASLLSGNECLYPKEEAKTVLKSVYGVTTTNPDDRLRFIIGKCNPVLLVPGIYATKLVVEFNCKGLATNERETTLRELRIFCGDSICKDETTEREEHPLTVALLDKAFTILGGKNDPYSSCLAFVMRFFQNDNECPGKDNKNICRYSKYVKAGFYGGTDGTKSKSRCGVEAVQNVLQSGNDNIDKIINISAARSYHTMINALIKRGYQEGFSLGGLPNDYRRFLGTNDFANKVFRAQINRLYENTGKPVVIVAHSYGTLLTLTLLADSNNKDLLPKIKKFIAIAPPFSGADKLLDVYLHAMEKVNISFDILGKKITITNYNLFGQQMMYQSLPTLTELRPLSYIGDIFSDNNYKNFADAIRERISLEKECRSKDCSASDIKKKSTKFDAIFKNYFPSLSDDECAYEAKVGGNQKTFNRKCYTELFNIGDCPTVIAKNSNFNPTLDHFEDYCGQTDKTKFYYQTKCTTSGKQCLDSIYYTKNPYVYGNKEAVNYLINRFNTNFSSQFKKGKIDESYFDTLTKIRADYKNLISHQEKINIIKDLPVPPVDTDLVYATFAKTASAFIYNASNFLQEGETYEKSGDGTVPSWSSLLTGMKWIFEKKNKGLKQKIKLVEYCSRLSNSGKYKFDAEKDQDFIALGCSCLNSNNVYKGLYSGCTHANMINDNSKGSLIEYVISVVDDPKELIAANDAKKKAVKKYDSNINYENECNEDLFKILDTAK